MEKNDGNVCILQSFGDMWDIAQKWKVGGYFATYNIKHNNFDVYTDDGLLPMIYGWIGIVIAINITDDIIVCN